MFNISATGEYQFKMGKAYICIGSNIGDRIDKCINAIREISNSSRISATSSFYITAPVGKEDQAEFINCVLMIDTTLKPLDLLEFLQTVEKKLGKKITERWGPRTIDLDILFYDGLVIQNESLNIPHPRVHTRKFVLVPMCEIDPDFIHPVLQKSMFELLNVLDDDKSVINIGSYRSFMCWNF